MKNILDFFYPPRCPLCDEVQDEDELCEQCESAVLRLEGNFNAPHLENLWFDKAMTLFAHEGAVAHAIHRFKYSAGFHLKRFFVRELLKKVSSDSYDLLIPIPLHSSRLGRRGYNPSAILAKGLSKGLRVRSALFTLRRAVKGRQQVGLSQEERLKNVKGLYFVDPRRCSLIKDKRILLIDDVMTTGATVNEAARVLKITGASVIDVLTLARPI